MIEVFSGYFSFRGDPDLPKTELPFRGKLVAPKPVWGWGLFYRKNTGAYALHDPETGFGFGNVVSKNRPKHMESRMFENYRKVQCEKYDFTPSINSTVILRSKIGRSSRAHMLISILFDLYQSLKSNTDTLYHFFTKTTSLYGRKNIR